MAGMDRSDFVSLVAKLTVEARDTPLRYRFKVFCLAMFGYVGMACILGAMLLGVLLFVLAGASTPVGWVLFIVLIRFSPGAVHRFSELLRVTFGMVPPPRGLALTWENAPGLFLEIERIRRELKAPRVHEVVLNQGFDVGLVIVPRLVFFGSRRYLCVGLALLESLSPEQVSAALAHELGQLSPVDGRFAAWVHRVGATWHYLQDVIRRQPSAWILGSFVERYAAYFGAYTLVLQRARVFAADGCSARVVGADVSGAALITATVRERQLNEELWGPLEERNLETAQPPSNVFGELHEVVRRPLKEAAKAWLNESAAETGSAFSPHPTLSERLKALGVDPTLPVPETQRASDSYLESEALAYATWHFSQAWLSANAKLWIDGYEDHQARVARLADLEARAEEEELSIDDRIQLALHIRRLRGDDAAEPLLAELTEEAPDNHLAWFGLGMILLERGDPSGVPMLEYGAQYGPETAVIATRAITNWYGSEGDAEGWQRALEHHKQALAAVEYARRERREWLYTDSLRAPELTKAQRSKLLQALAGFRGPLEVYVAAKNTHFYQDQPLHIIALNGVSDGTLQQHAANAIRAAMPEWTNWLLLWVPSNDSRLSIISSVANSRLR